MAATKSKQQNTETSPLRGFIVSGISKIIISRSPMSGLFYLRPSNQLTTLSINAMDEAHSFTHKHCP